MAPVCKHNTARARLCRYWALWTSGGAPGAQSPDLSRCRRTAPLGPKIAEPFEHMRPTRTPMQTLIERQRLGSAWNALLRYFDCSQSHYSAKYRTHWIYRPTTQIERRDDDHEIADPVPFTTTSSLAWVTQSSRGKAPADQCGNPRLFCSRLLRARTTRDRATSTHG